MSVTGLKKMVKNCQTREVKVHELDMTKWRAVADGQSREMISTNTFESIQWLEWMNIDGIEHSVRFENLYLW